jgi:cytochrome c-type biogenesis protein CcmH/NrfF
LWLLPLILSIIATWGLCKFFYKASQKAQIAIEPTEKPLAQNVAKQLETATIKHDLMAALQTIDKQALDNQALEFKIRQLTIEHKETVANLKNRIAALTLQNHP